MARCNNVDLLHKIGVKKLEDWKEVTFSVLSDLPDCLKINTNKFVDVEGDYSFEKMDRPVDRFECEREGCTTSGTLYLESAEGSAIFKGQFDATEIASGIVTMYVKPDALPIAFDVEFSDDSTFTNADKYSKSYTAADVTADGFIPVVINLLDTPTEVGTGWTASEGGVYVRVSGAKMGISTISFFDSIEAFETSDVVKIACLSEVGGTFDIPALETTCLSSGYDTSSLSFEQTITGKLLTPNYWKLNPLHGKGKTSTGAVPQTVKKVVGNDGKVVISDMNQDTCGFIGVQLDDSCNVADASLTMISLPTAVSVDRSHFQVVKNANGTTDFFFNTALAGKEVLITYPKLADVERYVGHTDNVGTVRVKMSYTVTLSDGTEEVHTFNNVLVTSFPASITNEETEFSFTVTIQRDADGNWYTIDRLIA